MIHFLESPRCYYHTDRTYLTQWFYDDVLIITDIDINKDGPDYLWQKIQNHSCKNICVDLSHNAMPENCMPEFLKDFTTLTTMYTYWYNNKQSNVRYFPVWMWMFSSRSNQFFESVVFDSGGNKTRQAMCLNRNLHTHRVRLRELLDPVVEDIVYSMREGLPGDKLHNGDLIIDIGVGNPVYSQCAVNIVTETVIDRPSLSEKSCKPFIARQIPVLVAAPGANKFLSDLGLDMFPDLVPWRQWDDEQDEDRRLIKISEFLIHWIRSGSILQDYEWAKYRIERNKQYFHSDQFRMQLLKQMPK